MDLCSAEKSSVICAEPHSRSSAEQFVRTERSVNHYPVYKNYKGFSDKLSYNCPIIIYSVVDQKNLSPNALSTWSYNKKLRVTKYHQQIPAKVGVCIIWFVINLVATKILMLSKNMGSIQILFHKPGVRIKCGVYLRSESNTMRTVN